METLRKMGVKIYTRESHMAEGISWASLAGGESIQKEIEESIVLPMRHPEAYSAMTEMTRVQPEKNAAGAYLMAGPPGVGKTLTARVIAASTSRPMVVLSFQMIGSAYHSQSESNLAKVLEAVNSIPGAILFLDEAESFFPSRSKSARDVNTSSSSVNEKLLSQMLTFLEGIQGSNSNVTVILATNRPGELDPALLSRCASSITFRLPDERQRDAIWQRYAKHLSKEQRAVLVEESEGTSGRDIKKAAELAERRHTAAVLRQREREGGTAGEAGRGGAADTTAAAGGGGATAAGAKASSSAAEPLSLSPPTLDEYLEAVEERLDSGLAAGDLAGDGSSSIESRRSVRRRSKLGGGSFAAGGAGRAEKEGAAAAAARAGAAASSESAPSTAAPAPSAAAPGKSFAERMSKATPTKRPSDLDV